MLYAYPAIFTPTKGGYAVEAADLPVYTCASTLLEAISMAEDAISMWLVHSEDNNHPIPTPSETLSHEAPQFISFIKADTNEWRRINDNQMVKKNMTIPA